MSWTDERIERLKVLWAEGLSASQIASELGHVTRNAVIGKVHRLGLSSRARAQAPVAAVAPRTAAGRVKPVAAGRSAAHPLRPIRASQAGNTALQINPLPMEEERAMIAPSTEETPPAFERITLVNLTEQTCRWPVGDPGQTDFFFCGCKAEPGIPYCTHHARIAYQASSERRRGGR